MVSSSVPSRSKVTDWKCMSDLGQFGAQRADDRIVAMRVAVLAGAIDGGTGDEGIDAGTGDFGDVGGVDAAVDLLVEVDLVAQELHPWAALLGQHEEAVVVGHSMGGFVVQNSLFLAAMERTAEIGLVKAIGARRGVAERDRPAIRSADDREALVLFPEMDAAADVPEITTEPDYAEAHNNLGNALASKGQIDEAIRHYQEALRLAAPDREVEVALHHINTQPPELPEHLARYQTLLDKLLDKDRRVPQLPPANGGIQPLRHVAAKPLALAEREFVLRVGLEHVGRE